MEKEKYCKPEFEILLLETGDVIRTSNPEEWETPGGEIDWEKEKDSTNISPNLFFADGGW